MSTLATTNIKHPSSGSNNLVLDSSGGVTVGGSLVGAGLDLIATQSFSAVSSVSLNNVFSATYENYLVITDFVTSAGTSVRARLRTSGTDNSTSNYFFAGTRTTTSGTVTGTGGASFSYFDVCTATGGTGSSSFVGSFFSPFGAKRTQFSGTGNGYAGGVAQYTGETMGGQFIGTTSFDGLTVYPASGTITGTIRVYGYKGA